MKLNRRQFVATSSAALVSSGSASGKGTIQGANDRIRGAFIGMGGMGRANLSDFMRMDSVQVVAVCDVWDFNRDRGIEMTASQASGRAEGYSDFRKIIDRTDIDFVVVSTPDHWHGIPAIRACESGKDVYVEKPLTHNIREGRLLVDAARKNNRVVQMGTQQRSGAHYQEAVKIIQDGGLGKVTWVRAWNYENESPHGVGKPADTAPPDGLDWDFWLGPAPRIPFNPNRFIGSFRWYWDYAGGKMTDWGTHHIDIIQWAMNVKGPHSVSAIGGNYVLQDNRETPDTLEAVYEYPGFIMTYESRVCNSREPLRRGYGIEFFGTDATMFLDRDGYEIVPEIDGEFEPPTPSYVYQLNAAGRRWVPWERPRSQRKGRSEYLRGDGSDQHATHVRNFLDCVQSRQRPNSDVEIGHQSTAASHLANISLRSGRRIYWDTETEMIQNDPEASKLLTRDYHAPWTL